MKNSTKLLYGLGFATVLGVTTAFATVSSVDRTADARKPAAGSGDSRPQASESLVATDTTSPTTERTSDGWTGRRKSSWIQTTEPDGS